MIQIESLLSARLFLSPQVVGERVYFISNLGGRLSLYAMDQHGSVPEPLLPPHIALMNPDLLGGYPYYVFPKLNCILVMIDQDGDENYQPMRIPLSGGYPEPAFGEFFKLFRVAMMECDAEQNVAYFTAAALQQQLNQTYRANLEDSQLLKLDESVWGSWVAGSNHNHTSAVLAEGYTSGDGVLYRWRAGQHSELLYGTPLGARKPGQQVPLTAFGQCHFTEHDQGLLLLTGLFEDAYGLGYLRLGQAASSAQVEPVAISGLRHSGAGELERLEHLHGQRFMLLYNIDGCSWCYEGSFDEAARSFQADTVICGADELANGVIETINYDKPGDRYALSFSTATSPTQLWLIGSNRAERTRLTNERVLGVRPDWLSSGEDASFTSFDGQRISARLYRPAPTLGFDGPRPLVYYIHGGPQGQERPNFAWFSMPLIQFLTLNGFTVFVPNARGSSGYGLSYMKKVDRDWGGDDRLDHVHAMTRVLPEDPLIETSSAAVVGRSYGGYMTLTLAARHPELWAAACDMFGPYDLLTFSERIPETWKPYFKIALGDPHDPTDRALLVERSPRSYIGQLTCPLLVIQGKNDPRVIERESRDVVEQLRGQGRAVEYLMFENEGHDVLRFENRVTCYNTITEFFKQYL